MGTHDKITQQLQQIDEILQFAEGELNSAKQVQGGNELKYDEAQQQLEQMNMQIESLLRSATPEQREELTRARQQVNQMQNKMILGL
ncbi:DUF2524 family protein [Anaerobacillus isosaccharinicus]|uniref:DUF2524 family protein n=1 Tax=Anaerobacillus isosaccharinicus TaxID=1532552 RepID=A0A1S2KVI9_9BACI|nr:DUF2524 family protein [Anaerobacillus isosaccharinicus]MBA5585911.1 DUF2524 family protein [Anaerobacillus isosaccharinicus]QOY35801.1 DUF2524 family protein [Anaerobacillus isosaccharinicus]